MRSMRPSILPSLVVHAVCEKRLHVLLLLVESATPPGPRILYHRPEPDEGRDEVAGPAHRPSHHRRIDQTCGSSKIPASRFDEIRERFRWNVPRRYNIGVDVCDRHAGIGGRIAVYVENAQGAERTFTFADLKRLSDRFANALAGLGVRRRDRVGVILPQRIETVVAMSRSTSSGRWRCRSRSSSAPTRSRSGSPTAGRGRWSPTPGGAISSNPSARTSTTCGTSSPATASPAASGTSSAPRASRSARPTRARTTPALLIYTSGTTGPPKGALNAHRCLLGNLPGFELSQNFFPQKGDLMWTPQIGPGPGGCWMRSCRRFATACRYSATRAASSTPNGPSRSSRSIGCATASSPPPPSSS